MTSRVSFYKIMLQDLRHRIWMIALSCLGSFLAMPVVFLLYLQNWQERMSYWTPEKGWDIDAYKIDCMQSFFRTTMPIFAGIILVAGAMIVGIWGFRHVYSKKMVDQYHSIPVKRRDLFLANYLNGLLIWLIPMLIGGILCVIFSALFLGNFYMWMMYAVKPFLLLVLNLLLSFLLIYHVTIVAVMLSGNILNTLVNGAILCFGAIALYSMAEVFRNMYFDTYYSFFTENLQSVCWICPFAGVINQLYMFAAGEMKVFSVVMNILVAVGLWAAGYFLYLYRPSELAEQGMKIKTVRVIFKAVATVLAGMSGWWFFSLLADGLPWQIFGTILAGVLCYGILDIVFHMDFKAFFAHKISLCVNVVGAVLICFMFCFDWIGYDSYMPDKEDIADMGIYVQNFGLSYDATYGDELDNTKRIQKMSYKNQENIYNLLKVLTERQESFEDSGSILGSIFGTNKVYEEVNISDSKSYRGYSSNAYVRVTEKDGRTYYRRYQIWETDEELLVPILADESYIRNNMLVPQSVIEDVEEVVEYGTVEISNGLQTWYVTDPKFDRQNSRYTPTVATADQWIEKDAEFVSQLLKAYNTDLLEKPEAYIYQEGKILLKIRLRGGYEGYINLRCEVFESMEHTIHFLKEHDLDYLFEDILAEDIKSISMELYNYDDFYLEEMFTGEQTKVEEAVKREHAVDDEKATVEVLKAYKAEFTELEDIEELLDILIILDPQRYSIFSKPFGDGHAVIQMKDGREVYANMKVGSIPERFLSAFEYISGY